jgi:hypothetical protein
MSRRKVKSPGTCYCCERQINNAEAAVPHLLKCNDTFEFLTNDIETETPQGCFVKVYDMNKPDTYWMVLAIPTSFTLKQMDLFLRFLWCECCNHLSSFELINPENVMSKGQTVSMAKTFADLSVSFTDEKQKLKYVYDYSDSTYLIIEFIQDIPFYSKSTMGKGNDHVYMIIRNSLPDFPCDFCSKEKGKFFCFHCEQYFGLRCHDLKKRHKCGEKKDSTNSVVSVVNSPRFGCCCYRGSQYGEEQSEFVVPFIETIPSLSSSSMVPPTAGSQFPPSSSLVDQVQSRTSSIGERRSSQEFRTFSWNSFEQMNNSNNNNNNNSKSSSNRNSITGVNSSSNNSSSLTSPIPTNNNNNNNNNNDHPPGHGQNNGQGNENDSLGENNSNNNQSTAGASWGFWKWVKG